MDMPSAALLAVHCQLWQPEQSKRDQIAMRHSQQL
jgi:hypothetical protein